MSSRPAIVAFHSLKKTLWLLEADHILGEQNLSYNSEQCWCCKVLHRHFVVISLQVTWARGWGAVVLQVAASPVKETWCWERPNPWRATSSKNRQYWAWLTSDLIAQGSFISQLWQGKFSTLSHMDCDWSGTTMWILGPGPLVPLGALQLISQRTAVARLNG